MGADEAREKVETANWVNQRVESMLCQEMENRRAATRVEGLAK
jgi:hypothetical protein